MSLRIEKYFTARRKGAPEVPPGEKPAYILPGSTSTLIRLTHIPPFYRVKKHILINRYPTAIVAIDREHCTITVLELPDSPPLGLAVEWMDYTSSDE